MYSEMAIFPISLEQASLKSAQDATTRTPKRTVIGPSKRSTLLSSTFMMISLVPELYEAVTVLGSSTKIDPFVKFVLTGRTSLMDTFVNDSFPKF